MTEPRHRAITSHAEEAGAKFMTWLDTLERCAREGCAYIALNHGQFAIVDESDLEMLSAVVWTYDNGYARGRLERRRVPSVLMHRVVTCAPRGFDTHHHNHDTLDNRKFNLKVCTRRQHMGAVRKQSGKTSQFKGVCWIKDRQMWAATGRQDGRAVRIGLFQTEAEAAKAYNGFASQYFGDFALLNAV